MQEIRTSTAFSSSTITQAVISFTREASIDSPANRQLKDKNVQIVGYGLDGPQNASSLAILAALIHGI
jgi:hypothetical protein